MMMSTNDTDHQKVPIWIGTDCKLVSGINKSTTCQNVIQSLVRTENPSKFVIVEKWKKMERKLDPSVRILKVWKAWGDQKDDVALILRHHHSTDGYIDKRISNKVLRRNKSSQHHKLTNHDENMEEVEVTEPMERLLKLVLTQGETIQAQLKKLRHQEEQIGRYEEQMHKMRSLQEGENYVVESYLRDDKGKKLRKRDKSPRKSGWLKQHQQQQQQLQQQQHHHNHHRDNKDSEKIDLCQSATVQMRLESGNPSDEDILEKSELMERICDLNCKLTKEEEHLVKLGLKIKKFYERHKDLESNKGEMGPEPEEDLEESQREEEQLMSQLEALRELTNDQFTEIELNEKSLNELEQMLDSKHDHVAHLTYQIQLVDEESEQLRQRLLKISQGFPPHPHHHYPPDLNAVLSCPAQSSSSSFSPNNNNSSNNNTIATTFSVTAGAGGPAESGLCGDKVVPQIATPSNQSLVDTAAAVNFRCQHPENIPTTQLNLHIKPCRDHQDNDSNSDTGISSLHSSSDENTLFVLDTLV